MRSSLNSQVFSGRKELTASNEVTIFGPPTKLESNDDDEDNFGVN